MLASIDDELTVRGERSQLALALGEVVDNAVRFSPPGEPVTVSVALVDGWAALAVTDAGADDTSGLTGALDAFVQGEHSLSRAHDGLGLGLSLTDRVARAHGGRVDIDAGGDVTVVSILLPVVTPGPHAAPPEAAAPTATGEGDR